MDEQLFQDRDERRQHERETEAGELPRP